MRSMCICNCECVLRPIHILVVYYLIEAYNSATVPSVLFLASSSSLGSVEFFVPETGPSEAGDQESLNIKLEVNSHLENCWKKMSQMGITDREDSDGRGWEPA